ncbi:IS66 family transposase, partial [Orrella sp. NBD-18]|nr:IS66 family transposase [Sheuella amnicola]
MQIKRQLPDNVAELQAMLFAQFAAFDELKHEHETLKSSKLDDKEEIKRLNLLLDKLKRMLFGQKSEKLIAQVNQLELEIEELEINQGIRASIIETKADAP